MHVLHQPVLQRQQLFFFILLILATNFAIPAATPTAPVAAKVAHQLHTLPQLMPTTTMIGRW
ncbi:MAG: hypothetical protein J6M18_04840 [Actinomycetaceae bacterium]|nr:hypothetical protein [Actinomycetaceae bacterium]